MKRGETFLPECFLLTDATLAWMAARYPTVDIAETREVFCDKAAAKGWSYRDWQAAFRNYVRNGRKFGGLVYKAGRDQDPRWMPVLAEARQYGFREPTTAESPAGYKTALDAWKTAQKRAPAALVLPIKRFGG